MKVTEEILEKIELYLDGQLSADSKQEFEILIENNKEIAEAVAFSKDIKNMLADNSRTELEKKTKELSAEYANKYIAESSSQNSSTATKRNTLKILALLAIIGVALLLIYKYSSSSRISNQSIYTDNYKAYTISSEVRSTNSPLQDDSSVIDSLLQEKNYTALLEKIKSIEVESLDNEIPIDKLEFYKGMAFIELDNVESAKTALIQVIEQDQSIYKQASLWYLSLLYLKEDDLQKAKESLELVTTLSSKGKYFQQATKLLNNLKH